MDKNEDPIAAFGSAEEGNEPLKPYMDPTLFDTIDKQAQIDLLTPVFDAITLAGVDYDLKAQDSATGKRYTLLKNEEVIGVFIMEEKLTEHILEAMEKNSEDD
ncbi:hypothetical protein ACT3TI_08355 [Psychrobacter sp. AOP22-C1-22]|uniref:hypothetical protein n=1 Tax=unclassified Psychrobacter TaxID=196806 RepID=UPI0017886019|nr:MULTISPECIES: hypothetical protein [unclassified Psychrobacter]MDN5801004.1 hypothetical protein [Psychrobacter sp.]MBE0406764.1 hypothetical protein [Psychrobacter sp. FME6]MBE0444759.1 hypothetical protein [Psychrobacter sp. FME5]MDN5891294.1 hypothetical protein [Psychrobacter sp.]MDN5897962.1 hypothetical protein [Psychrobacter sp.]